MPAKVEIEDLGGFKIAVDADDCDVSRQVREDRWYTDERFETSVFAELLRPGMSVLDVGGNIGFYAMLARSRVGAAGRVVVFEPFPRSAALIRASIEANGYTNVDLVEAAVAERAGSAELFLSPDQWSEHSLLDLGHQRPGDDGRFKLEVPLVTVDGALERLGHDPRVDLVKMDIEGAEWRALQGMRRVLDHNPRLTLMTELWPNGFVRAGASARAFLEALAGEGFAFRHLDARAERVEPLALADLLELIEANARRTFEDDPVMRVWGWYTNLLCVRDPSVKRR
jgi:FkbM family methyltransferase